MKKKAIVIGAGAGGATVAREIQGSFDVTIVEAGGRFTPFGIDLGKIERLRKTGILFDEREIQLLFPAMRINRTQEKMVLVRGMAEGGTTTLATGNAVRVDQDLQKIGIHLDREFAELENEIPISTEHRFKWRRTTRELFDICDRMGLAPIPTPKMVDYSKCKRCGRCVLGCPEGAKWDVRSFLDTAVDLGAKVMRDAPVRRVVCEGGRAVAVEIQHGFHRKRIPADLVLLAAGGLGTPEILERSGIPAEPRLFVDPVLCVAGMWKDANQNKEIPMPFIVQRDRYIVAPYFDHLSFFFNKKWKGRSEDILSLMIKLADENTGSIVNGSYRKSLTENDREALKKAVELCTEILVRMGVPKETVFLGTLNAGHAGGMLPLRQKESETFHNDILPENLYVADATLFPRSLGNPPILTIMAMAKRVGRICIEKFV